MSKLPTTSKDLQLNCKQISGSLQLLHCFEHAKHFHISHFTFHILLEVLYYNWSYLNAANTVLTSYIKICYVYVNFRRAYQKLLTFIK